MVSVTFPKYELKNPPLYLVLNEDIRTVKSKNEKDSLVEKYNLRIAGKLKDIGVEGIQEIPDSMLSIYNTEGIKANALFDDQLEYTCELSVPLKYLGFSSGSKTPVFYTIKLNGGIPVGSRLTEIPGRGILTYIGPDGRSFTIGQATPESYDYALPTQFSGRYVLAEK